LLQASLDQTIDRESLEEASDSVSSVARADCSVILRNMFGIVVSNLPFEEATAFQAALLSHDFPTEVVADDEIPVLHEAFTIQRIGFTKDGLNFTDTLGRETFRPMADLVFVAGGFLMRSVTKSTNTVKTGLATRNYSTYSGPPRYFRTHLPKEDFPEFRLDFFFSTAPHRLRAWVSSESTMFFRDSPLRLRDTTLLMGAMMDLNELLPEDRVDSGLKQKDTKNFYPSLHNYEEEIRWHFHRLKSQS
jgi:hypothetical protein